MSWRQILRNFHPNNIIDCIVDTFKDVVELWAILRVTIILALVLYTIVINIHANFDKRCNNEILDTVDRVLCQHINCRGNDNEGHVL